MIKNVQTGLIVITYALLGCSAGESNKLAASAGTTKYGTPNVILIYAYDLGRGLLSGEGQQIIKTPNIDRLAKEGMRFENGKLVEIEVTTRTDCGKSIELETAETYNERWNMEGKTTYSQNIFLEKILAFIRENKDNRFFLYHPTQLPHGPVSISKVYDEFVNDNRLTQIEKEYTSMVKMLDNNVGIIMNELKVLERGSSSS